MTDRPTSGRAGASANAGDRAARLAAALRANLHKRKAQARAGHEMPRDPDDPPPDQPAK